MTFSGVNLRHLVRQIINSIHPDRELIYFRSEGLTDRINGIAQPIYKRFSWSCQVQSDPDKGQYQSNRGNENTSFMNVYLFSNSGNEKPAGMVRPMSRTGDFFFLKDEKTWWRVDALAEDFSSVGWCRVKAILQHKIPDALKSEDVNE